MLYKDYKKPVIRISDPYVAFDHCLLEVWWVEVLRKKCSRRWLFYILPFLSGCCIQYTSPDLLKHQLIQQLLHVYFLVSKLPTQTSCGKWKHIPYTSVDVFSISSNQHPLIQWIPLYHFCQQNMPSPTAATTNLAGGQLEGASDLERFPQFWISTSYPWTPTTHGKMKVIKVITPKKSRETMGSPWFLNENENSEDGLSSVLDRHGTRLGDLVRNLRVKKESFRTYGPTTKWTKKGCLQME